MKAMYSIFYSAVQSIDENSANVITNTLFPPIFVSAMYLL